MYKLLTNLLGDSIQNLETGGVFSATPGNADYAKYLAWLALGNEPEPADVPTAEQIARALEIIAANEFTDLPEWAAYTATEAADAIHNAILAGDTLAQAQAKIDALPATIAGMKTGLKQVAAEFVTARGLLEKMAKAVVYLRDRT